MKKREIIIGIIVILITLSNNAFASVLSLGEETIRFEMTNLNSSQGNYLEIDLGYGRNKYQGYGITVVSPYNQEDKSGGGIEVEYQFIPLGLQNKDKEFNYAIKAGGATGTLFNSSDASGKIGFIIEKELEDKLIYLDFDIMSGKNIIIDNEIGICGEFETGIYGVIGFKLVTSNEENVEALSGVNYGVKIDF